jgi:ankyrin repeat protein
VHTSVTSITNQAEIMASTNLYSEALEVFQQSVLDRHKDKEVRRLLNDFLMDGKSNFSTPDAAREAAGKLATDTGEKYGGIKIGKVEIVPKQWVDNVLGNIDNFIGAGSLVMKNAPESVGMAWFAISLTLKAISNHYSLYALFGKGLTDITEVMIIIMHYDRLYDERQKPGFTTSTLVDKLFRDTVAAYAAVLDFSFSVKKHMSGGAFDKVKHGLKDFFNTQASKFQGKLGRIAELKGQILESSQGAFQDKTMQQFEGVQVALRQIQQHQSQALELQREQNQVLYAMLEDFKELKDLVKRKTPWDFLKEEFSTNKKKLTPLAEPHEEIGKLLAGRENGTCEWILEDEKYQSWIKSDKSEILCVLGGALSGKSTILASLYDKFKATTSNDSLFVNYVSCSTIGNSQAVVLGGQKLSRIYNTLLYRIYELASFDSDKISLLETCNQIFRNPKGHKAGPTSGRGTQSDELPDFVDAMGKLIVALQRDTIIVIDAVDTLSQQDQVELHSNLQELVEEPRVNRVSVLIGSRSDSAFIQRPLSTTTYIHVGIRNRADMEAVLDRQLKDLTGWLDAEKQLAKETILAKAGPMFSYIHDVALPFLREPFQRPISRLPEGLNESFEQAIHSMPQKYFELLQLSVTWCLLAPKMVTVKEILEAYSGVYTVPDDSDMLSGTAASEESYDVKASDLEVQQIFHASGPFLSTERTNDGQTLLKLQDARQVRKFCEYSVEGPKISADSPSHICDNCKSAMTTRSTLAIDPKIAHFEIALTLLRHLNHPLFQRRFGLLKESTVVEIQSDAVENGGDGSPKLTSDEEPENESTPLLTNEVTEAVETSGSTSDIPIVNGTIDQNVSNETPTDLPKPGAEEKSADVDDGDNKDDDAYTEPSVDEDFDNFDYIKDTSNDTSDTDAAFSLYDCTPELRCEINSWPYHLREAEKLWPPEERKTNETWIQFNREVQAELKKFADNEEVFNNWQKTWGRPRIGNLDKGYKPLHLAACVGLSTWVESLLDDGADINEISEGHNVSQASALLARYHENLDLLRLLLARGANFYEVKDDYGLPGFHIWLLYCNNPEIVKAFVDHGANFDAKDRDGWTGLHTFAWSGTDVESFRSIMNPKDPAKRPNINAMDYVKETPLHRLLWRREVPLDLLREFLAIEGIDINHEDSTSQQPLGVASKWGSLSVVKLLLQANADVKDEDNDGCTALHKAAQGDHVKCIEALLEAHSELDARDKGGSTPLHHAAYHGRKAAVELLLSRGSDLNTTSNHNRTPFFNATRSLYGDHETAQLLLNELKQKGYSASDINKVTKGGRTPLRQAAHHGFAQIVKGLLECIDASDDGDVKATINKGDEKLKRTPLHCAAQRGDAECVRLLLQHGADAALDDGEGKTALVIAQEQWTQLNIDSFEDVLLQLIDRDQKAAIANAELPSIAAARGSVRVLQKLHSLRADLNRTDSLGWTPLAHAKHLGHVDAQLFLKHQSSWGGTLPSKWVCKSPLPALDETGLQVTHTTHKRICIVSDKPLPPNIERFYFEITLESLEEYYELAIGFCTLDAQAHKFPGWVPKNASSFATSWGYHGDDGGHYHKSKTFPVDGKTDTSKAYGARDTVGCGVDLETHKMWFTKNGEKLDYEFTNVRGRLYPILGMADPLKLTTNFGLDKFKWQDKQIQAI